MKILILAYDFPPYNSVGGQRPYGWFKYLKELGHEPIVVTRHWDNQIKNSADYIQPSKTQTITQATTEQGIIYRAPFSPNLRDRLILKYGLNKYSIIRKLLTIWYMTTEFLSFRFDNKKTIYHCAQKAITEYKPDIIIATGEPFILFRYAFLLSKKNNIPWIADYRDGWSTNYTRSKWERKYYSIIEKSILSTATSITAASQEFATEISSLTNKSVKVLLNGYFEELFKDINKRKSTEKFIIGFAGTLYPYQPIELIADGIKRFIVNTDKDVELLFVGVKFYPEQMQRIQKAFANCNIFVEYTDRVEHSKALDLLNQCSALLLPANKQYPQIYAKVFDYLALQKNILLCESDEGSLKEIITHTQSGFICNTATEIETALTKLFLEWKQSGSIKSNSVNIEYYSRKNQVNNLAKIIEQAIK